MTSHRLALILATVQIAACTLAQRNAAVEGEQLICALAPVVDPSIPAGIEAQACAMAEDATRAIPVSADAVAAKARSVAALPPSQASHVVPGHGLVIDHRVVVGMHVDGGAR